MTRSILPLVLLATSPATGEPSVPTSIQAAIIGKLVPYVRTFPGPEVRLLVVYTAADGSLVDEAIRALNAQGLSSRAVELGQLENEIASANAVYVLPGPAAATVKALCQKARVLSISAVPSLVESGELSIGVGVKDGKPQILVNLTALEAEGHQVSSELLKLAKVIQ